MSSLNKCLKNKIQSYPNKKNANPLFLVWFAYKISNEQSTQIITSDFIILSLLKLQCCGKSAADSNRQK